MAAPEWSCAMREIPGNSEALAAFSARKATIDKVPARLAALSSEHFNRTPDAGGGALSEP